jgi:hypothetical protein
VDDPAEHHLETMWRDTWALLAASVPHYIVDEIKRIIPRLTDGRFQDAFATASPCTPTMVIHELDHAGTDRDPQGPQCLHGAKPHARVHLPLSEGGR